MNIAGLVQAMKSVSDFPSMRLIPTPTAARSSRQSR